jgi:hypothetical protein
MDPSPSNATLLAAADKRGMDIVLPGTGAGEIEHFRREFRRRLSRR